MVWKFWREALGLSWEFLIGCKDSSGLIGFDYDGLHFFTFFFVCFWFFGGGLENLAGGSGAVLAVFSRV